MFLEALFLAKGAPESFYFKICWAPCSENRDCFLAQTFKNEVTEKSLQFSKFNFCNFILEGVLDFDL